MLKIKMIFFLFCDLPQKNLYFQFDLKQQLFSELQVN